MGHFKMKSAAVAVLVKGKNGLIFLLCTILFWLFFPLLFALHLIPAHLYRFLVIFLQKLIHPDWIGMMDATDAFLSENPNNNKNNNKRRSNFLSVSIHVMSGTPNVEKIRQGFLENIYLSKNSKGQHPYNKFSYYIKSWLGFRFWKKDRDFNVENHIKLIRLKTQTPNPNSAHNQDRDGDGESDKKSSSSGCYIQLPDDFPQESFKTLEKINEERLYKSLGDDAMTTDTCQMPKSRSPWELLILPNYQPKFELWEKNKEKSKSGREFFVIILRFQHSLFDGFSLKKMITVNLSGEKWSTEKETETETVTETAEKKKFWFDYLTLEGLVRLPMQILRFNWLDKDENDWHIPPEKLSENWHSVLVDPIPFNAVQSVGKKLGVSTNTVIFGALDGAIQRLWKLQNKYEKLPKQMRVPFPWSIEGHPMNGLVNHWSFGEFQFPLKSIGNQKERFLILEEQFQRQKRAKLPELFWHTAHSTFSLLPHSILDRVLVNGQSTLTVSSFPGPRAKLTFLEEWPLEDWTFCVPKLVSHSAFQVGIMSYRGWIRIVLTVNTAVMPSYTEVQQFGQCIQQEIFDLENMIK